LSETLAATGQLLNDFESVSFFLKGLGSEYDPFVTSVTTRVDPLSIDELYGHLAHEMRIEQQLPSIVLAQPSANISSRSPMSSRGSSSSYSGRHYYHGLGSSSINRGRGSYFSNDTASSSRPTCQICGKLGHTALRCYQRQDSTSPYESQHSPQAYYSSSALPIEDNWYLDARATHHVTSELQHLNISSEDYHGQDQIRVEDGWHRFAYNSHWFCISHSYSSSIST
jgi:hypothetical protein